MADELEPLVDAGGPAVAKAARFLSTAADLLFHQKLMRQQYALFECATAIAEVETAVTLVRGAAKSGDALALAQARVWASDVAVSVPTRLLKLFSASEVLDPLAFADLQEAADLPGAMHLQSGRLADMDAIARMITK